MHSHDSLQLPFELVALEAALKEVVNAAGMQVKELEAVALPALDALTKNVSEGGGGAAGRVGVRVGWVAGVLVACGAAPEEPCAWPPGRRGHLPTPARRPPPAGQHRQPGARAQGEDAAPAAEHPVRDAAGRAGALFARRRRHGEDVPDAEEGAG